MSSLPRGDGVTEATTFNQRFQTTNIQAGSFLNLGYTYSATQNNGSVQSHTITPGSSAPINQYFTYDVLNRISVAAENPTNPSTPVCPDSGATWCEQYNIDRYGNRTISASSNLGSSTGPAGFDGNNRNAPNNGASGWYYDAAGHMQRDSTNQTYAWDAEGRMTAFCPNQSNPASCTNVWALGQTVYAYDGAGQRVQKTAGDGTVTTYVYDAMGELAAEYGGTSAAAGTQYLTADVLGTTRMVTTVSNGAACVTARLDYLTYGGVIPTSAGTERQALQDCGMHTYGLDAGVRQKFTGMERDGESGLDFFQARYMASAQGRFMSADDPFNDQSTGDPQSWNLYGYVRNNPVNNIDPDGAEECDASGCRIVVNAFPPDDVQAVYMWFRNLGMAVKDTAVEFTDAAVKHLNAPRDNNCVGAYAAAGAVIGTGYGASVGAGALGAAGAIGGTLVAPGVGTVGFGLTGAAAGGVEGGVLGGLAGGALGGGAGWLLCAQNAGPEGGDAPYIVKPTPGQVSEASRLLAQGGKRALEKSLKSYERRLAEHLADLEKYKQAGGYTSSVEREIRTFQGAIQAIKDTLSKLP